MNELKEIYERITFLRQKGVKMKEMAQQIDTAPSVLSAIYTTVLPEYFKNLKNGMEENEALDHALVWVNNVSKKKLLSSLAKFKRALFAMEAFPKPQNEEEDNPFFSLLNTNMQETVSRINNYSGIYLSYSISSSNQNLKIEPYLIAPSGSGNYAEVFHRNSRGSTHQGIVLMNGFNHLYLIFNEHHAPQLALFHVCLKLPMLEHPPFLRGIYTCFDYNYNPNARRILFVKQNDSISPEEFAKLKAELKTAEELNETENIYYNYTCRPEDVIRMCNIPSPQMTNDDLIQEKKILSI